MSWVRSDDNEPNHPKVFRAGAAAYGYFQAAKCYCSRNLTDGFIPVGDLSIVLQGLTFKQAMKLAIRLVECGLFEKEDTGYRVHDYLHYNPSKTDVVERRQIRAASGKVGGLRSAEVRRSNEEANRQANATAVASTMVEPRPNPNPNPNPVPVKTRSVGANGSAADADAAFIATLKLNPAYRGIDVDREIGKAQAWLLTPRGRGKKLTRQRLVNWLNRVDQEVVVPVEDEE